MLINHRSSAYVDNEELERAAGMMEIRAQSDTDNADVYASAAVALRILQKCDVKTAKDFVNTFENIALAPAEESDEAVKAPTVAATAVKIQH